jgi:multicomponent K+:H+ antiporter subunit A
MAAGIIEHESGTRDMRRMNGLWAYMPYTGTLAIVAASAMAGVPLLNGFLSKEMFFAEALELRHRGLLGVVTPAAVALGGAFSVAYSARFVHDVFFNGEPRDLPRTPHEAPRFMKVPVEVLVAACVAVGLFPGLTVGPLVQVAARAVFGADLPPYSVAVWHGFTAPLLMSAVALAGGAILYWALQRQYNLHLHVPLRWSARNVFNSILAGLMRLGERGTAWLDNGSLPRSLALVFAVVVALPATALLGSGVALGDRVLLPVAPLDAMAGLLLAVAAVGCVAWHRQRLVAVILLSVVGLLVSLAFLTYSAPDLALTQLSVEVVTTVLMLMALTRLPQSSPRESSPGRRARDAALAALVGVGAAGVALAVMTRPLETISWYFMDHSVPLGGGRNVVNVILVDFRGYDTFGEITVLAIAALGMAALLDGLRLTRAGGDGLLRPSSPPLLFVVSVRWLLPLAIAVPVYVLFRGHNAPGGGFVAGLITAVALVMVQMAHGFAWATARLPVDYARLAATGLLVAGATGAAAWCVGHPFLTSAHAEPVVPLLGRLPLASAAVFDVGVYLAVVGATMLMLASLASASRDAAEP